MISQHIVFDQSDFPFSTSPTNSDTELDFPLETTLWHLLDRDFLFLLWVRHCCCQVQPQCLLCAICGPHGPSRTTCSLSIFIAPRAALTSLGRASRMLFSRCFHMHNHQATLDRCKWILLYLHIILDYELLLCCSS